jgi:tetratricopeptide (TPR) repeat protein
LGVLLFAPAFAVAESRELEEGRRLFREVEYEKAALALRRALEGKLSRNEQIEAYLLLAKAYRGLKKPDDAAQALRALLQVDPEYRLSASKEPPSLIDLLERLRQEMITPKDPAGAPVRPPRIEHTPVTTGYAGLGVTFQADLFDIRPEHRARIFYRRIGQIRFESIDLIRRSGNRYVATIPGTALMREGADYLVEYYLAVTDALGETVARVASDEKPLHFRVLVVNRRQGGNLGETPPWYRRYWWIWVAVGIVVVGGTVGGLAAR